MNFIEIFYLFKIEYQALNQIIVDNQMKIEITIDRI